MRFFLKVLTFTIARAVLAWPSLAAERFEISFPKEASAAPLDGHVMLVISTKEKPDPRFQISFTAQSQMVNSVHRLQEMKAFMRGKLIPGNYRQFRRLNRSHPGETE